MTTATINTDQPPPAKRAKIYTAELANRRQFTNKSGQLIYCSWMDMKEVLKWLPTVYEPVLLTH